jgi:PBSX family phage terminase large subunit
MAKIKYSLHTNQGAIWTARDRYRVLVAGRRFGKTTLAIHELLQNALLEEKSINWYISPTYKQSKMVAWELLQAIVPETMIYRKYIVELRIVLDNGSEICLKGADNEDTLRGVGLGFVVLDEYAQMKSNVWFEVIRPMLTDTEGRALFIGTPKGKNALWELYLKGQKEESDFKSWRFKTSDNPFIKSEEIEQARKELPERFFKQEYEASFEDYTGLVYPEFTVRNIIEPTYLPIHYQRIGAIDPAISGITGVLKAAIDETGAFIIYSEHYELNQRVNEVAQAIKEEGIKWYIDPASGATNIQKDGRLYSLFDEYGDNGIHATTAENDVEAGINRVGEFLKQGQIKIFSTCKSLIYELERYHWTEEKETAGGMLKPKPYKKDDHLVDCLRYILMSRVRESKIPEPPKNPNSIWNKYVASKEAKENEKGIYAKATTHAR